MSGLPPLRNLNAHRDARGTLVAIEGPGDVPFAIARVYYILAGDGSPRGFHAHRELQQMMICVAGSCRIVLDDGRERAEHRLDRPDQGLFVRSMTWREMHDFASGTILLVLASEPFDEADYIRDYNAFLAEVETGHGRGG